MVLVQIMVRNYTKIVYLSTQKRWLWATPIVKHLYLDVFVGVIYDERYGVIGAAFGRLQGDKIDHLIACQVNSMGVVKKRFIVIDNKFNCFFDIKIVPE